MLSYRHAFHAGNHTDVLKHFVLVYLLDYLTRKDKPLWFVDTHAGAAVYELDAAYAQKNVEYESGIGRLWLRKDLPAPVADYVEQVRTANAVVRDDVSPRPTLYPGSPQIAMQMLREQDRLRLFELHRTESRLLGAHFKDNAPRVMVQAGDGFDGLKSLLPPRSRRGLIFMDPSYEDKRDYGHAIASIQDALRRFATGTYVIWYPIVQRRESQQFAVALKRMQAKDWLHVALTVKAPSPDGFGLYGSGLFLLNPPWTLPGMLRTTVPYLVRTLGQDKAAGYVLESDLS